MGTQSDEASFGWFFAIIGGTVGFAYGGALAEMGGAIVGLAAGAWLGLIVGNIVYRLIIVALLIVFIVARQAFFDAMFAGTHPTEPQQTDQAISEIITPPPVPTDLPSTEVRS